MRIIKATDPIPVDHPIFAIFGQPGIGKSSLGYSAAAPLTLDFDRGAHRAANRRDTLVIETWADVAALTTSPQVLEPYQTIVVDTVGRCLDVLLADIAAETPKLVPHGNPSQQGWGVLKSRFRTWIATLRTLGKDVVLLAHDKEDKDGDTRIVRPDIVGGSFGEVLKVADFVGYMHMAGKDRVLDFSPTDRWLGKNPGGWAPIRIPPVAQATTVLAELLDKGRAALGRISAESAQATATLDDWRAQIATFTTAEECQRAIPEIKALPALLSPQVAKLLVDHATLALGLTFDKKRKLFVAPIPEPAVVTAGGPF